MSMFRPSKRRLQAGNRRRVATGRELRRRFAGEQLEGRLMMAADVSPWQNPLDRLDVNNDASITTIDALVVANGINNLGQGKLSSLLASARAGGEGESTSPIYYDTNGDQYLTSNDFLRIANALNAEQEGETTMTYTLKTFNADGTAEISTIGVGQNFQLRAFVKDNRVLGNFPNGTPREGVFAAYLDVKYPAALADVAGPFTHNITDYGQAPSGNTSADGIIDGAGSFRGSLTPLGRNEFLLWSLPMTAQAQGAITFTGEPTTDPADTQAPPQGDQGQSPSLDTGVYGEDRPICPSVATCTGAMGFVNATLNVVTDISAMDDSFTVLEDAAATSPTPAVTNNDSVLNPPGASPTITAVTQGSNGATVTFTNTNISYRPAANFSGTDTITYTISNGQGATATATVTVTVTPVNDAPVATVPGAQTIGEDVALVFNTANNRRISVADPDGNVAVQTTLAVTNGQLSVASGAGVTITGNNTGSVQLTGTVDAINAVLDGGTGVTYQPNANFSGNDTLTVTVNDQGNTGGAALSDSKTVAITITATNDAPVNTVPTGTVSTDEEVALTFSTANGNALAVNDVDAGNSPLKVNLSIDQAAAGTLNLASTTGLTVTGNGTTAIEITGPASAINAALGAGLTYTPAPLFLTDTPINFTMRSDDQGATGSGGAQHDLDVFQIAVIPTVRPKALNDTATIAEDTTAGVTIDVLDNDRPNDNAAATLLTFTQPAAGGTVTRVENGAGNTDDELRFVPNANFSGNVTFTYTINDTAGTGADSTATVVVTVTPVNDAPVNTVPGAQAGTEDNNVTIAGISVADIDAGTEDIEVTLAVGNGSINVTPGSATVQNNGSGSVKLTGTLTEVNAALASVVYTPAANFSGSDTLTVTSSDLGNTGSPGVLTDTDTVAINIAAVNDAPVNSVPAEAQKARKNQPFVLSTARGNAIQVSDVDAGNSNIQVALTIQNGTLSVASSAGVQIAGSGSANVTLTGPVAAINTALSAGVTYTPTNDFTGPVSLNVVTNDQGNTGSGGAQTDSDTVAINVATFDPSTVAGGVYIDANANGVRDAFEIGLANVVIKLTGTDQDGAAVNREAHTDEMGRYEFADLAPGSYTLEEMQPAAMLDGADQIGTGLTAAGNDRATITIPEEGGVNSTNTLFAELGLSSAFVRAGDFLLASSARPDQNSGVMFGQSSTSLWSLFKGEGWDGYDDARFTIISQTGVHAVVRLTVRHVASNADHSVTLDSSVNPRLTIIQQNGETVIRFKGRPQDLFTVAAAEGEAAMSAADYANAVDAVMDQSPVVA